MSEAANAAVAQIVGEGNIASEALRRPPIERGLLIGGKSVPTSSARLTDDVSPWDGQIYARVAAGTPEDIARAAEAAQAAFPAWSKIGAFERREIFLRAADVMAERGRRRSRPWPVRPGRPESSRSSTWRCAYRCCARRRRRPPAPWASCCRPRSPVPTRWPSECPSAWWGRSHRGTRRWF